jgi:integrase
MGCVYERSPGSWWIKWREGARLRYAHGYASRELAEQVLAKIVADIAAGRAGLPADPKEVPTLGELAVEWLERRKATHRAAKDDRCRWNKHLKAFFGARRPAEVDHAAIRRFVESKLTEGVNSGTVGHFVRLLSTVYSDLVERGLAPANPVRTLPRSTRRLYRPSSDPRKTPFLEGMDDVRRLFLALPEPINVAFAVGALAGLRTGEVLGLDWQDVDLSGRRIQVRRQVRNGRLAPLKDDESRVVPIQKALTPVLAAWRIGTGGDGLLFRPRVPTRGGTQERPACFMRPHTLWRHLYRGLAECRLPRLTWYQATRHTFASNWVLGGGSIEKLAMVMGHSSIVVTERYAHLRPDLFRESDYGVLDVDLAARGGEVIQLVRPARESGAVGYAAVTQSGEEGNGSAVGAG